MTEINITKKEEKDLILKALFGSPFFNIFASVLATFIVGTVFFKYGGGVPIQVTQTSTEKLSTFDVSGEGKVVAKPDQAELTLGVSKESIDIAVATEQADSTMKTLVESLKKLGIKEDDIKTTDYSVYPSYDYETRTRGSYTVHTGVKIVIREIERAGEVVDLVGSMGLEQSGGLNFTLSDEKMAEAKKEAREQAISQAKDKAKELADLANMSLGRIVNVIENSAPVPAPYYGREMVALDSAKTTPAQINPGSSEVVVSVTLSYETR